MGENCRLLTYLLHINAVVWWSLTAVYHTLISEK